MALPPPPSGPVLLTGSDAPPAESPSSARGAANRLGGIVAATAAVAVLTVGDPGDDDGLVLCPFRYCTGGYCPGCGGTRAAGRLLRGDLAGAWARHPFVVLLAAQLVVLGGMWTRPDGRAVVRRWRPWLVGVNVALLVVVWVIRLAVGDIPVPFA